MEKTGETNRKYVDEEEHQRKVEMEKEHIDREEEADLGVFEDLFSAKSGIDGQDGGVATALLVSGIKEGVFDCAVVVQRKEGYSAEASFATNVNDVIAAKGTKYLKVRVTPKLRELLAQGKNKIAIVGTPCEARVARRIQQTSEGYSSNKEVTIIGLFCFGAFNGARLKQEVETRLGIDLDKVEKIQVRSGKFTVHVDGKEYNCKVKDLDLAIEEGCRYCDDFTSRYADISIGAAGSEKGYSTVIVRSAVGKKLLENVDLAKKEADKEEIGKLSRLKKQRAKRRLLSSHPINGENSQKVT
jgi:coenzyme F420-reducing hydrogenase beta subunit